MLKYFLPILVIVACSPKEKQNTIAQDAPIISKIVDPKKEEIAFFLKNSEGENYGSIQRLKSSIEADGNVLNFAMNGGMYKPTGDPVGLYIEYQTELSRIDTLEKDSGNFYLLPNGIFYIDRDWNGVILPTRKYIPYPSIRFATQSGPMLVIGGELHPAFNKDSNNKNIRNGVGILPDGRLLFAISTEPINFYDFAFFFQQAQCKNALFLDGVVSRAYIPEQGLEQMDGEFGVIIGEVKSAT